MRRLRESWLALGGSALIIALSVSSALGADPALDAIDNVGQQVSEFAQSLQNGTADEPDAEEQPDLEEDEQLDDTDEDAVDTDADALDADTDALLAELAPGDEGFDWTTVSHGFCVSWHAHEDENAESDEETSGEEGTEGEEDSNEPLVAGDEGYVWGNHGEFVSFWATEGCYEEPEEEEATEEEEEVTDETLEPGDEDFDWTTVSHGFCVSWHAHEDETSEDNAPEDGGSWTNHGDFVSHWAQEGCRTAPEDSDEAGVDSAEADSEVDEDSDAKAEEKAARKAEQAERRADRKAARRGRG